MKYCVDMGNGRNETRYVSAEHVERVIEETGAFMGHVYTSMHLRTPMFDIQPNPAANVISIFMNI